jgi:hypothetical protein
MSTPLTWLGHEPPADSLGGKRITSTVPDRNPCPGELQPSGGPIVLTHGRPFDHVGDTVEL